LVIEKRARPRGLERDDADFGFTDQLGARIDDDGSDVGAEEVGKEGMPGIAQGHLHCALGAVDRDTCRRCRCVGQSGRDIGPGDGFDGPAAGKGGTGLCSRARATCHHGKFTRCRKCRRIGSRLQLVLFHGENGKVTGDTDSAEKHGRTDSHGNGDSAVGGGKQAGERAGRVAHLAHHCCYRLANRQMPISRNYR